MKGAKGLSGGLTAAFRKDGFFYLLKGSNYWKAERVGGSLEIAKDGQYPKDVFVDFFGCPVKVLGACVGGRCNFGSAATSSLASLATTDQSWKKVFFAQKHANF